MARVTVSIVAHESREVVLDCLASLGADAAVPDREIVVLDNSSVDGSADAVAERFPRVSLIRQRHRAGFGTNHNTIAARTEGEYLFVLNDDTVVDPGCVETLAEFLDRHPAAAVAGPPIMTGDRQPHTFVIPFPSRRILLRGAVWPWRPPVPWHGQASRRVDWANGCAMLIRRAAFDEVGGFDEGYFMYGEEKDLCRRLARRGWETWLVAAPGVVHFGARSTTAVPGRRLVEFWRSQRRYLREHVGRDAALAAPFLAAVGDFQLALASRALRLLPARLLPRPVRAEAPGIYLGQAAAALRVGLSGGRSEGLRELADAPPPTVSPLRT